MDYIEGLKLRRQELQTQKDELEAKLKPILKEYEAITNLLKVIEADKFEQTEYPGNGSLQDKILFIVKELGSVTASKVVDYMRQHETSVSQASVVVTCSKLFREGILKRVNISGKENIYSL